MFYNCFWFPHVKIYDKLVLEEICTFSIKDYNFVNCHNFLIEGELYFLMNGSLVEAGQNCSGPNFCHFVPDYILIL